jgi:hypothetical protein
MGTTGTKRLQFFLPFIILLFFIKEEQEEHLKKVPVAQRFSVFRLPGTERNKRNMYTRSGDQDRGLFDRHDPAMSSPIPKVNHQPNREPDREPYPGVGGQAKH